VVAFWLWELAKIVQQGYGFHMSLQTYLTPSRRHSFEYCVRLLRKWLSILAPDLRQYTERTWGEAAISVFQRRCLMKTRIALSLVMFGLALVANLLRADEKDASASTQRLEALKQLKGDWVELGKDGKPTDKLVSSIRVTSAGSTVQETLFPGTDHEMVTMYHLDGPDLILTHYCMLGNQPRMRAVQGANPNVIAFKFIGGTNLKSDDEQHMDQATLTIEGTDHFKAEWVSCKDGKSCHKVAFNLVRKGS
jgi:hypothetical protein